MSDFKEYPHETALRLKREAAEELYNACEAFMRYHDGDSDDDVGMMLAYAEARDAIVEALAKARGE